MRGDKALREVYEEPPRPVTLRTKQRRAVRAAEATGHRLAPFKVERDFTKYVSAVRTTCLRCNIKVNIFPDLSQPAVWSGQFAHHKHRSEEEVVWPACGA